MKTIHDHAQSVLMKKSQKLHDAPLTIRSDVLLAAVVCQKFQARYLHKWTSGIDGIEEIVVAEWSKKIAGLTDTQIAHGLMSWSGAWPPSADEFVAACKNNNCVEFGLNYYPEYYRKQRHEKLLESKEMKVRRKKIAKINLKKIRDAIGGW